MTQFIVERSTTGPYPVDVMETGWTERHAGGSGPDPSDGKHHFAKLRAAGSNPISRSIVAGQGRFFKFGKLTYHSRFGYADLAGVYLPALVGPAGLSPRPARPSTCRVGLLDSY